MATHSSILAWIQSHGQRSLVGYGSWGHKEIDMTEVTELACTDSCFIYRATWRDRDTSFTLPRSGVQAAQERQPSSLLRALPKVTRSSQQKLINWVFIIALSVFPNVSILTCDLPKKQLEIGLSVFSLGIISHHETITQFMRCPTRPVPLSKGFKFRSYYMLLLISLFLAPNFQVPKYVLVGVSFTCEYCNSCFSDGSVVKNPPASAGDTGNIPWVGKIPWRRIWRKWQPMPVFLPGQIL